MTTDQEIGRLQSLQALLDASAFDPLPRQAPPVFSSEMRQVDARIVEMWHNEASRATEARFILRNGETVRGRLCWNGDYYFQIDPQSHKEMDFAK